jgi:hypothetical protein
MKSAFRTADLAQRCRNAQQSIRKLILLDQFQFGLPLNRKAIMLRANWRLPGGRPATHNVRSHRKRLHTPAGEEANGYSEYQRTK